MLKNYLKIAFRSLWKRKVYSLINIIGLAIGIAACLLIILYVQDEFSYDKFHVKSDRTYRVIRQTMHGGVSEPSATTNYVLPHLLKENFPQVEEVTRIAPRGKSLISNQNREREFVEQRFFFAEPATFKIFDFNFLHGSPESALNEPFSIILTQPMAEKYFDSANPLGQTLTLDNDKTFSITAVVEPLPPNSHFHFDFLASFNSTIGWYRPIMFEHWGNIWMYNYLLLEKGTDYKDLERQIMAMLDTHGPPALKQFGISFQLQPLENIHLYSNIQSEIEKNGSSTFVYVFMAVALLILLIASFNFINLATARSAWRAKEVGIRKVVGAVRRHLIFQFLGESILLTLISTALAILMVYLVLPSFNEFAEKSLSLTGSTSAMIWAGLAGIMLFVGISSGSFPAFMLSAFKPIQVLKGNTVGDQKTAAGLRKVLVVFQFSISLLMIIGTIIVYQQLNFMKNKDLGFASEQVLVVPLNSKSARDNVDILKTKFLGYANITQVSAASDVPPSRLNSWRFHQKGAPQDTEQLIEIVAIDYDYLDVLDLKIAEGRKLSKEFSTDQNEGLIFNEAAVKHLGLNTPLSTRFVAGSKEMNVVGIVSDFHFASLHEEIKPLALHIWPSWYRDLLIKVKTDDIQQTIEYLRSEWDQTITDWAFEYYFLDDEFNKLYLTEERLGKLVTYFSILAVFVASLGLFGLASFMAEQRIKEIGIRRVLGASIKGIVWLQFRVFLSLVVIAMVISVPLGYYSVDKWLQDFAYRIEIDWIVFAAAGALAIVTALITVSYQSIKAAVSNPVDCLRYE